MKIFNKFFSNFEEILSAVFLCFMIGLVIVNVFLRYLFNYSIFWAEEVSTICFVWAVFLGASAVYKHRMDVGIDVLVTKMPPVVQRFIRAAVDLILLLINGYIFYMSIIFTRIAFGKPTAVLGISSAIYNSALIVGFGLITFHTLRFMIRDLTAEIKTRRKARKAAF
jgi:TRAP-type C4-dicarboxylate transport system permease small subunit